MKSLKYLFICSMIVLLAVSCHKLDPIDSVAPGADTASPGLVINYPVEGKPFVSPDSVATITIKLVATDDIELKSVILKMDGTQIGSFTSFKDYRRAVINFNYSNMTEGDHSLIVTATDLADKITTDTVNFKKITAAAYTPLEGEVLYFPFDDHYLNLITGSEITVVGAPGFATGKVGDAYAGAADAYMTYPTTGILGSEFSVAFWYKLNPVPKRAGLISISSPEQPPDTSRKSGFRFLREDGGTQMKFGINFGIGSTEVWMNPFMTIDPTDEWMHFAISISATKATIYVNGAVILEKDDVAGPISWKGCSSISIASGEPNFIYWEHFSDLSLYDEMHFFTKAITAEEVQALYNVK
jgi:hypothetical protein